MKPFAAPPPGPPSVLQQKISELEKQLRAVTQEREDLARDVESLCLQSGGSGGGGFAGSKASSVLTARLVAAEGSAKEHKWVVPPQDAFAGARVHAHV